MYIAVAIAVGNSAARRSPRTRMCLADEYLEIRPPITISIKPNNDQAKAATKNL